MTAPVCPKCGSSLFRNGSSTGFHTRIACISGTQSGEDAARTIREVQEALLDAVEDLDRRLRDIEERER